MVLGKLKYVKKGKNSSKLRHFQDFDHLYTSLHG
jgi:hypothetical protein